MFDNVDPNDPDRNLKKIGKLVGVSNQILRLAIKNRESIQTETSEEREERILKGAKDLRSKRASEISNNERFVLDLASYMLNINEEETVKFAIDSNEQVDTITSLFKLDGLRAFLVQYLLSEAPGIESGRYNPKLKKEKIPTVLFSTGYLKKQHTGRAVGIYRHSNIKAVESKFIENEIFFISIPEGINVVDVVYQFFKLVFRPCLAATKDYGSCSDLQKREFVYGVDSFIKFLESTKDDLETCKIEFHVDQKLFKGHLLAPHQVEETSIKRDMVAQVEKYFEQWMKQIKGVIAHGQQLAQDDITTGPLKELERWRKLLARYDNVKVFIESRPFQNFLRCLKLSRCKLVKEWEQVSNSLNGQFIEIKDNVRFLTSIEKYWDPLYRCEPKEITEYIPPLLTVIREVYTSSNFFNTSEKISSFLSKVTNQLIVVTQNFLTDDRRKSIWNVDMKELVEKIRVCKGMQDIYRSSFDRIVKEIQDANQPPLECSPNFLFTRLDKFTIRLSKIREIMDICLRYQILKTQSIAGIDFFIEKVNSCFQKICNAPYDPLEYRKVQFDSDFVTFQKEISMMEIELGVFTKNFLDSIPTTVQRVLALKKFQNLKLVCLNLSERFVEFGDLLITEIEDIKDKYNEERGKPPLGKLPPACGRIMWVRSLYKKIKDPMEFLMQSDCIKTLPNIQMCLKIYNFLAATFVTYESTTHLAWYTYVDQVRSRLEVPILKKNPETNHYEINLNPYVQLAIKECESMWKLNLDVPEMSAILVLCQNKVFDAYNQLKELVRRNDQIRHSIYPIFLPLMRIHLTKLERIFAPALSQVTWLTFEIDEYFNEVKRVLWPIESFVKDISDVNDAQIERQLAYIENYVLVDLPNEPVEPETFKEMNNEHRRIMQQMIEIKSLAAEKAAVDLINRFVEMAEHIPLRDESGKFQVPLGTMTQENRRVEEIKPINKYDWLQFDKIYKPVGYASESDNLILCYRDYEDLNYDITLLHIDCVELFAYYNHRLISVLSKSIKKSMELLKARSNLTSVVMSYECCDLEIPPLLKANMQLYIPDFKLTPNIRELQSYYDGVLHNIVETCYGVSTWGKQAKLKERTLNLRPVLDEIRHEKNMFIELSEHKEVVRYKITFDKGVAQLEPEIIHLLEKFFNEYSYLWSEERTKEIDEFVKESPLTADIRDKLMLYEETARDIKNLPIHICVGLIEINCEDVIEKLVVESHEWKSILGNKLCEYYRTVLEENIQFINAQKKILSRDLRDLDDCRIAMDCLKVIRDEFMFIDQNLMLIEQTYELFQDFKLEVPPDDEERVDGLRYQFNSLIELAAKVSENIDKLQGPLLLELENGVIRFTKDVEQFDDDFIKKGPMVEGIPAKEASDRVLLFEARVNDLERQLETYSAGEKLFALPVKEYPIIGKRKRDINFLNRLYKLYLEVMKTIDDYFQLNFREVSMDQINTEISDFVSRCKALPRGMRNWPAYIDLKKKIDDFFECCPLIEFMASNAMKERHWKMLEERMNYKFDMYDENFTLGYVMKAPLYEHKDDIEEICVGASKEQDIENKLQAVVRDWKDIEMPLAPFKSRGEILIKAGDVVDIVAKLEDSLMIMSSLASNRFNGPFKKDIMLWSKKLFDTSEILERWLQVQSLWMYLEAVFVGGDISRQLPMEAKRFGNIDKAWVKIMYKTRDNPNVIEVCTGDDVIHTTLKFLIEQLELCQKSLTVYLESKRLIFPRFFFISDPVLLEILGQASDPNSIQPHLLSIFDGVASVEFDDKRGDTVVNMASSNGEKIAVINPVRCIGLVEIWIGKLLESVLDTVRSIMGTLGQQIADPKFDYQSQLQSLCGQAQLICIQLVWTKKAEYALNMSKNDRKIMARMNLEFQEMLNFLVDQTVKDLTKLERISAETLVTIHVHQRDIFDELVKLKIKNPTDFEWQKQARFYYDPNSEELFVKITDINFIYQNEYLGVTERLAITPLTDRCYITLAQAVGMFMGGAPAGPAGTGKTETTKDMGRALGKLVVVFNCSDQMDFRGLGRIFKGLAQSGSWGCFDEFNRIELPVLSVAAQQIYIVLNAKRENLQKFIFMDGDVVKLNPEFGLFITMNPGYAGRQELPENLKIQFRTVAMMVPDRQIIMRVKLASCGFRDNVKLAAKFYTLYKLCEEQLSKQVHYDFGLRNILSVLRTLGAAKRAVIGKVSEDEIVMQVLRDMNLSKLVDEDEPLFLSLISDLFPGLKLQTASRNDLQDAIKEATKELKLVNHPAWNLKIVQLYETSLVRHGLMVLGPTGAGKTKCMNALLASLTILGLPHRELRMNPKAITAPQMFGRLDVTTNDWTDGIFSVLWRRTLKFKQSEFVWLVLDGPVDAVWIENLNSVLDDNKTLTLANGDRIVMSANCKLVFEPDAIDNASPATVSRMGMVFMSSSVMPWQAILEGWLLPQPRERVIIINTLFKKIYGDLITFVLTKLDPKMKLLEAVYIRQTCDIIVGLMKQGSESQNEVFFLFACMWSLGALLELDDRDKFEEFVLSHPSKMKWPPKQEGESIFEYGVDSISGTWVHWSTLIEEYIYPPDKVPEYSSILVPNVDNVRTAFLIHTIARQNKSVLLIGEQGTAKTVMIKGYMAKNYNPEIHLSKSFNFSSATMPVMFQRTIESYVEKRVGLTFGPPQMRKMTIFIDDINMPVVNEWGDQITNEIVRQLMECSGFYSLERPGDFVTIQDIQFIAAMIHAGGGRNDIPARLKRQFSIFNCTLPSTKSMDKIFGVIGNGYFCPSRFNKDIVDFVSRLIPLTRKLWQQTKIKMLPTPAKFHYIFNLRDLSRIWGGMLKIERDQCTSISDLLKLWSHECTRVISDRFINTEDRQWFKEKMHSVVKEEIGEFYKYFPQGDVYFVDFLRDEPEAEINMEEAAEDDVEEEGFYVYEEIPSFDVVKERIYMFIDRYNVEIRGSKLDIVLFQDALIHLIIISRILRTSRGNALLVGVGGSGKQSLTKLASFIADYKFHQITLTRAYNLQNFAEEFKYLYRVAGLQGLGISFIFTDNDIKEESFLEYLNNVLSSGEIANLYMKDEIDEITNELIPVMKKKDPKRIPTQENLYDFFITRARNNLHVVLCFSPVGEKFRSRALKFPGLISGCMIDWFQKWPMDALVAVSTHILTDVEVNCTENIKNELIKMMAYVHDNVSETCIDYFDRFRRQTHVTPKSFLSFLSGYKVIYNDRIFNIVDQSSKMSNGLGKLKEAAESVDVLKKEMEVKRVEIAKAEESAKDVIENVEKSRIAANIAKDEAEVKKAAQEVMVQTINAAREVTEAELEKTLPELRKAEEALLTVKSQDIAVVRRLGKPPHLITVIMDCVLILSRKRLDPIRMDWDKRFLKPTWTESTKMMSDTSFLKRIREFKKDSIDAEKIDLLQPYFKYPNYTVEAALLACGQVAGLLKWTKAMSDFYFVNVGVIPLKSDLNKKEAMLEKASEELSLLEKAKEEAEKQVQTAEDEFKIANDAMQDVKDAAALLQSKLDAAHALITGLSEERVRWTEQIETFKDEMNRLVGDTLILTGFLSYTGPFNQEFRATLQVQWQNELKAREIPYTLTINVVDRLTDTATIGEWNLQGLPNDELSIQNGIIVTQASRYPLLIDPQSQGKTWIKQKEKENNLIVTTLNHKYFRNHLEDAIQQGLPMLIEDVGEDLDPCLDNVLEKNYVKMGGAFKVKVGDKEIDVNDDFRLFITTKLPNPSYRPEVAARTSVIDFTVTMRGLEDQLLGRVILSERSEIERERVQLDMDVTANKKLKKQLEANLLYKLSTTEGSLLDDLSVMEVLNISKAKAIEIKEKLESAEETKENIYQAREEFRPVASRGSVLYFLIVKMSLVNNMYQTSLVQFLERFDYSLTNAEKFPSAIKRINAIIEFLTYDIFKYKSRGLYEAHKFLFVLLMALDIDLQRGEITFDEFQTFVKGGAALDITACPPKPYKWITDLTWLNLVQLSMLPEFNLILDQVKGNNSQWKNWYEKDAPEEEMIPNNYSLMDVFRKLLIIRSFCLDRTLSQSRKYISSSLGADFADPVVLNYDEMLEESRPLTPIICFLSMGSDPTPSIEALAKKNQIKVTAISMGQGQEVHARKLIENSLENGSWVLLQNCHLGLEYMNEVTNQLMELERANEGFHELFRLWITTEVHPNFPITMLQMSIKFTNEPPAGIRAGLKRTFNSMSLDLFDYTDSPLYLPLIYTTSFLHTIVQERRKFGALGWNIPYEFNSSDWYASCLFMQKHLDNVDVNISWKTVNYMIGEVQYGGRVTDDYDKRMLNCISRTYFNPSMFEEDFEFYEGYKIVIFRLLEDYVEYFDTMPSVDPPYVYGLHANADITYQTNKTNDILDTIISVQPKESAISGGETREATVTRLVNDMLTRLPPPYDEFEVKQQLTKSITPMNIFLRQEIDRIQRIILLVKATLNDLLLAIEGTIIMSENLRDAFDNIYDARVPKVWKRGSWLSSTLGFWFSELIERNIQFTNWCFNGRPLAFWMTGFFNPQGFLTAMRQETARANVGWALDKVILQNEIMKFSLADCKEAPKSGVYVHGLFLDGAGWSRREMKLVESTNKVLYTLMPIIRIYANNVFEAKGTTIYECPVYKKANRTDLNYIVALNLPTSQNPDHWILRGVALLCDIK